MKRIAESELIINGDGSIFHLHLLPEDLADRVILVGDQGRVPMIAQYFDKGSIEVDKSSREFHAITGKYQGIRITALSTGIGTDNIDIVMTELDALANIDFATRTEKSEKKHLMILRIGTCGGIHPDIPLGSFVYSKISLGCDGLLNWYDGVEKVSDIGMEKAFMKHFGWNKRMMTPYFVRSGNEISKRFEDFISGITLSAPGFYGPQGRSVRLGLTFPDFIPRLESFRYGDLRVTNIEMENSAITGLSALLGHEAGTVCCVIANRHLKDSEPDYKPHMLKLIQTALDRLIK